MELKPPLLLYDADCPLCVRFKQGLERLDVDKRVTYCPIQNEEVFAQFTQLDRLACRQKVHYLREDGAVLTGGEVVTELLHHFPGVSKFGWLLDSEIGRKTVDFFYEQVEQMRTRMKEKEESCGTCPGSEKR